MRTNNQEVAEVQKTFLVNARESTVALYFNKIADGIQRELGEKPPHNAKKIAEDSNYQKIYQTDDSVILQEAATKLSEKMEIIGL